MKKLPVWYAALSQNDKKIWEEEEQHRNRDYQLTLKKGKDLQDNHNSSRRSSSTDRTQESGNDVSANLWQSMDEETSADDRQHSMQTDEIVNIAPPLPCNNDAEASVSETEAEETDSFESNYSSSASSSKRVRTSNGNISSVSPEVRTSLRLVIHRLRIKNRNFVICSKFFAFQYW